MAVTGDRERATVIWVGSGFVFALNDYGTSYLIHPSGVQTTGQFNYHDLVIGSKVELTPIEHPKGPRGIEVKILEV